MALFGKKTPNEEACCASNPDAAKAEGAAILVLGAGCPKCRQLEASVKAALAELGTEEAVGHVTDYAGIAAYGVMSTPALVVDGKIVSYGKGLTKDEVAMLLKAARG